MIAIYTIAVILFFFSLTIFVHELGHFLAARAAGLKVEVFSIGFGPPLLKRTRGGVTYQIGAFPFGGYVALPQLDPTGPDAAKAEPSADGPSEPPPPLPRAAPGKRIFVAAAGAAGNLLLALFLAWIVFFVGKPSAPHERRAVVGFVEPDSVAWEAGLRIGDEILSVNGTAVGNWQDLLTEVSLQGRDRATLRIRPADGGPERAVETPVIRGDMGARFLEGVMMEQLCMVGGVVRGGSAEAAGLRAGDLILALDGIEVRSQQHLIHLVGERRDQEVAITIRRDGETLERAVRPAFDEAREQVMIGVRFSELAVQSDILVYPRPLSQVREHAMAIFRVLRALTTRGEAGAAAGAIGGPVSILFVYWLMVRGSFMMAVSFTIFLNVNLAILNLLPIPVLDGGHILFASIEGATRRPVSPRIVGLAHRVFAALLITLFVFLTFRDALWWVFRLRP